MSSTATSGRSASQTSRTSEPVSASPTTSSPYMRVTGQPDGATHDGMRVGHDQPRRIRLRLAGHPRKATPGASCAAADRSQPEAPRERDRLDLGVHARASRGCSSRGSGPSSDGSRATERSPPSPPRRPSARRISSSRAVRKSSLQTVVASRPSRRRSTRLERWIAGRISSPANARRNTDTRLSPSGSGRHDAARSGCERPGGQVRARAGRSRRSPASARPPRGSGARSRPRRRPGDRDRPGRG